MQSLLQAVAFVAESLAIHSEGVVAFSSMQFKPENEINSFLALSTNAPGKDECFFRQSPFDIYHLCIVITKIKNAPFSFLRRTLSIEWTNSTPLKFESTVKQAQFF